MGIPAAIPDPLFLEVPSARTLREMGPFDAISVVDASYGMSPAEMDVQPPAVLSALAVLPVPLGCCSRVWSDQTRRWRRDAPNKASAAPTKAMEPGSGIWATKLTLSMPISW